MGLNPNTGKCDECESKFEIWFKDWMGAEYKDNPIKAIKDAFEAGAGSAKNKAVDACINKLNVGSRRLSFETIKRLLEELKKG
jgi:hypothetical protein